MIMISWGCSLGMTNYTTFITVYEPHFKASRVVVLDQLWTKSQWTQCRRAAPLSNPQLPRRWPLPSSHAVLLARNSQMLLPTLFGKSPLHLPQGLDYNENQSKKSSLNGAYQSCTIQAWRTQGHRVDKRSKEVSRRHLLPVGQICSKTQPRQ